MNEPRTHYQLTLTSRQAVGLFAGLHVALGVAFALGLMTGLSQRGAGASLAEPQGPAGSLLANVSVTPPAAISALLGV